MSPEQYKELFAQYNTVPARMVYVANGWTRSMLGVNDCAACAVGIRIIDHHKSVELAQKAISSEYDLLTRSRLARESGLSEEFCQGLDQGWESSHKADCASQDVIMDNCSSEDWLAGYTEGRAAGIACQPKHIGDLVP